MIRKHVKLFSALLLLLLTPKLPITAPNDMFLPINVPEEYWRPLRKTIDWGLQRQLKARIETNPKWARLIKSQNMALALVDLSDPFQPRCAPINGDYMMYAASLPKIAILLAACQSFEDGILKETAPVLNDLNSMIRHSDNAAATRMIDRLGFAYIESVLTNPKYNLYDPAKGGGLWVGKRYARYGSRYADPMKNLAHAATATQVARFYYMLATGRLINETRSRQMLDILSNPGLHHKFVNSLDIVAKDAQVYRKSGTWRFYHSDSVLVWGPYWRRYILVGLVTDKKGEKILRDLLPVAEEVLRASTN